MTTPADLSSLLAVAGEVLDVASERFVAGRGAPRSVDKGPNDFATDLDLELERSISSELERRTGISVHGEEFGGPEADSGTVWLLDPIDGTVNYSAGLPTAGILLALVRDGDPVLGLTWLPFVGDRFAATAGGPLLRNGRPQPPLQPAALGEVMVGVGSFDIDSRGRIPGRRRLDVITELSRRVSRLRMHGSTGVDLAYTAAGVLGAAVVFGHHPWDNAAGVALVRAAGGRATDFAGEPWRIGSGSVVAGAPGVHEEILDIVGSLAGPVPEEDRIT
ncbi:inositol monophosphatase [Rhodococcus ruber Chol-4]|uniref:inositol-phosphate phosphatase n=1 Tax=Rhodococcus ruber TaxID=1830 RepID=A0A098BQS7_9NOCA|nr:MULTISPECIES: inositol monophosphatase family protein [Rhodococcus]MDO2379625.1 inositol monophosphatase family protein [Rhodococcus ruber]RIK12397.1 MAG: inositol monophosphatase family protein [Acidobacteriota bacterium]ATQ28076.1 inositol monophosphatase [Rhodococcus ruber]AUM17024.1 inositol monophosphatase family protein [Rhodococcus ruber]AWG99468.1 inositol monophosphatase family protein [Rhodococcus ruber]